ncbi:unnamed protein product, partial [Ectocarpus sp. 12 AP-2014]
MGTELSKQQCREGGDNNGRRAMDSSSSTSAGGKAPTTQVVVGKWAGWLQGAEVLYLQGKFRALQEALQNDVPPLPTEPLAASLLKAVAKANAAIGGHAESSLFLSS